MFRQLVATARRKFFRHSPSGNADEHRQLKGELLKLLLLRRVDGPRLIRLADQLLALSRE